MAVEIIYLPAPNAVAVWAEIGLDMAAENKVNQKHTRDECC